LAPNPLRDQAQSLLQDRRVQAFLEALRQGESGGQYNIINGGRKFDNNYSAHPNISVPQPKGPPSTAAGAYQFIYPTWSAQPKVWA
jgi:muramidase (phage lysozyme)